MVGLSLVVMSLLVSGCASISEKYMYMPESEHADTDGLVCVTRIKSRGSAIHESKKAEYKSDSKSKGILHGFSLMKVGG